MRDSGPNSPYEPSTNWISHIIYFLVLRHAEMLSFTTTRATVIKLNTQIKCLPRYKLTTHKSVAIPSCHHRLVEFSLPDFYVYNIQSKLSIMSSFIFTTTTIFNAFQNFPKAKNNLQYHPRILTAITHNNNTNTL